VAAVALGGCGAQEAQVVGGAFEKPIDSANVTINLSMANDRGEGTSLSLAGPMKSNGAGKLPSVDWKLRLVGANPQPIGAEIFSTTDDAFVVYDGETYEVGRDNVAKLKLGGGPSGLDLSKVLSQMRDWFPNTQTQSDATLNGEPVTRVSGNLDLSAALKGLKQLDSGAFKGVKQLSPSDLRQIDEQVSDPRFIVDVAKSDGKLRRVFARMRVKQGREAGTIQFMIAFRDVDKPVTITAPTSGKPIDQLVQKLGQDFGGGRTGPGESASTLN
jgi:hypothetical protein